MAAVWKTNFILEPLAEKPTQYIDGITRQMSDDLGEHGWNTFATAVRGRWFITSVNMNPFAENAAAFAKLQPEAASSHPEVAANSFDQPPNGVVVQYPNALVQELLSMGFRSERMLTTGNALMAFEFAMRTLAYELSSRCAQVAREEYGEKVVDIKHLEKVLPQFLLDLR